MAVMYIYNIVLIHEYLFIIIFHYGHDLASYLKLLYKLGLVQ